MLHDRPRPIIALCEHVHYDKNARCELGPMQINEYFISIQYCGLRISFEAYYYLCVTVWRHDSPQIK